MAKFTKLDETSKRSAIDVMKSWGRNALSTAQRLFNRLVKSGSYDLDKEIKANPWFKESNGGALAKEWFIKTASTNREWQQRRRLMEPGKLYMFVYANPKTADILDWWDVHPLVLSLGNYTAEGTGNIVEMGVNLHHLPLQVRFLVITAVFNAFAKRYKGEMYRSNQSSVPMNWQMVGGLVKPFGADFAFRSYLPQLRTGTIEFPYEEWSKAIFVPSFQYQKLQADQIFARYVEHCKSHKLRINVSGY